MHCSPARWTRAVTAAAWLTLPVAAAAQQPDTKVGAQAQDMKTAAHAENPKVDAAAAKQHLSEARNTLSQLTSMPEAARLQGDARTQVSQLISNFNELITMQSEWRSAYAKVDANLAALLGPEAPDQTRPPAGVTGAVGTSGATQLDPAIRAKLVAFRTHLKEFERAADSNASGAMAPSVATGATTTPANPAPTGTASPAPTGTASPAPTGTASPAPTGTESVAPTGTASGAPTGTASGAPTGTAGVAPTGTADAAPTGTTGVTPSSPTANMAPADQTKDARQLAHAEADKHLDAISAILDKSKTGTLTKAQTAALKKHVAELRQLLQQNP